MADLFELRHPTADFTVKADAERRTVLLARGYRDVGTTAASDFGATVVTASQKPVPKPPAKRKPPTKPVRRK